MPEGQSLTDATNKTSWVLFDVRDVEGNIISAHYWPATPQEEQEALERCRRAKERLRSWRPPERVAQPVETIATPERLSRVADGLIMAAVTETTLDGETVATGIAAGIASPILLDDHVGADPARTGADEDPMFPVPALNRAAFASELSAISEHVRGYLASMGRVGIGGGKSGVAMTQEARNQLAMFTFVKQHLPPEFLRMSEIVIDQVLQIEERAPLSVSQVGAEITQAKDERVRKGGVIGYYRALFQMIRRLQREYWIDVHLKDERRRLACRSQT